MLRPELELTLKKKFSDSWQGQISAWGYYDLVYSLQGRDNYTSEVLDSYEKELQLRDTFIQGSLTEKLDTKIGRQIVVWGALDNLRVTDVLNPLDLRVLGLTAKYASVNCRRSAVIFTRHLFHCRRQICRRMHLETPNMPPP